MKFTLTNEFKHSYEVFKKEKQDLIEFLNMVETIRNIEEIDYYMDFEAEDGYNTIIYQLKEINRCVEVGGYSITVNNFDELNILRIEDEKVMIGYFPNTFDYDLLSEILEYAIFCKFNKVLKKMKLKPLEEYGTHDDNKAMFFNRIREYYCDCRKEVE